MATRKLTTSEIEAVHKAASELGVSTRDLAAIMGYETGGSYDPWQKGPTTKWGTHRGLIQFGEPQRKEYGVSKDQSFEDQLADSVVAYFKATGVKPGMGLAEMYSAVNAGGLTNGQPRWTKSDVPGKNVRTHVNDIESYWYPRAEATMAYATGVPMPPARGVSNTQYPQWDLPPVPGIQPVQSAAAAPASPSYDFASRVPEQFRDQAAERDAMLNGTSPPSSAAAPLTLAQRSEQAKAAVSGLTEAPQAPRLPYGSAPFPGIQPVAAPRTSAPVSPGVMAGMSYPSSPPSASVPAAPQLGNPSYTGAPNQNPYAPTQYKTVTTEPGYWKTIDIPGGPQLGNPDYKGGPNENPYAPTTIPAVPPVSAPTTKKVWVEPVTKRVPIPMPRFNPRRAATPAPQPQRGGWGALWTGIPKVLDGLGMLGGGRLGNLGNLGFSSVNVNMAPTYTATGGGKAAAPSPSGGPNYDYTTGLMSNGQFAGQYENNAGTSITYVQNEDGSYSHIYG